MTDAELKKLWQAEEGYAFQGWDFSHLNGRWDMPDAPWDYRAVIKSYLKNTDKLLDMGTGGGEFLLTLEHPHKKTYATEAYEPNYELCKKTLSPLGITIERTYTDENFNADDKLPFGDDFFDVIINRHESFDLKEVDRTLKRGGYFITQQVGSKDGKEFARMLNDDFVYNVPGHSMENYTNTLSSLGYKILQSDESEYSTKFYDVGALVFYAKIIAWEFPRFCVETHFDKLLECQRMVEEKGYLQGTGHRFLIVAQKV